jgi:hypothetical protein
MTEQGAATIAARFFDDRDQLEHRAAIGQSLFGARFHCFLVDRNACQFVMPFGSNAVGTIVREDAISSEGIVRYS